MMSETKEKIGGVTLDYTWYSGQDYYSDGAVEDEILDIVKNTPPSEYESEIRARKSWPVLYHLSSQRENIVDWIPFDGTEKVLEIGAGPGAVTGALARHCEHVTCVELSKKRSMINAYRHKDAENIDIIVGNFSEIEPHLDRDYDYIFMIGVLEYAATYLNNNDPFRTELMQMRDHLKPESGRIVIAIENRLGLKYFAGAAEDHSGRYFDGIESYTQGNHPATTFTRPALEQMFHSCGFEEYSFYYPYPDYKFMNTVFSDRRTPTESELSDNIRNFDRDRLLLFDEKKAYKGITRDGLYPVFANSYEVILGPELDAVYCKYSGDRDPQYRIRTEVFAHINDITKRPEAVVVKYPLGDAAKAHVMNLEKSCRKLKDRYEKPELNNAVDKVGLSDNSTIMKLQTILQIAPCWKTEKGEGMVFPFVPGRPLEELLDGALGEGNIHDFLGLLTEYRRRVGARENEKFADYDMTFANILINRDVWTAIDYEWAVEEAIPVKSLLARSILVYFREDPKREQRVYQLLPEDQFYDFLGVTAEEMAAFGAEEEQFQVKVTGGTKALGEFRADMGTKVLKPAELQTEEEKQRLNEETALSLTQIQVYFETGNGYNESESYFVGDHYGEEGLITFAINVPEDARHLRVDPTLCPALVVLREAVIEGDDKEQDTALLQKMIKTNGKDLGNGAFLFTTNDPNMEWNVEKLRKKTRRAGVPGAMKVTLTLQMSGLPSTMAAAIR